MRFYGAKNEIIPGDSYKLILYFCTHGGVMSMYGINHYSIVK